MNIDRAQICKIISEMLDNPGECEIYPTGKCYDELEKYVESVRTQAIGWTHADACTDLDNGRDLRKKIIPEMLERAKIDLEVK